VLPGVVIPLGCIPIVDQQPIPIGEVIYEVVLVRIIKIVKEIRPRLEARVVTFVGTELSCIILMPASLEQAFHDKRR
jgi:hypothetical protein